MKSNLRIVLVFLFLASLISIEIYCAFLPKRDLTPAPPPTRWQKEFFPGFLPLPKTDPADKPELLENPNSDECVKEDQRRKT